VGAISDALGGVNSTADGTNDPTGGYSLEIAVIILPVAFFFGAVVWLIGWLRLTPLPFESEIGIGPHAHGHITTPRLSHPTCNLPSDVGFMEIYEP